MAGAYERLLAEIDRIVLSPYPTQLKRLRDIACAECTDLDTARWALSRPCQIECLAECLLEGLRQWPYVLELISRLSHEVAVRDAIFQHSPTLLYDIVSQAVKAASPESRYTGAAVALLSHPLPEHIAMPSEAQTLFTRLFDQAADEPSLCNIRKVYQILKGTSSLLLGHLSSSSLGRLEQQLFGIIRNVKADNQSLSLYCLAIMKTMTSASHDELRLSSSQYDTQELLASRQLTSNSKWTADTMQQFFTDSKAQKTVQLVVLRAMWACTTSTGEPLDDRMESLLLANEVISAIAPHLRETWRKTNSLIVGKLKDKVTSTAVETELRFQGLCFLAQVSEGSRVPATVMDSLRPFFTDPQKLREAVSGAPSAQLDHFMDAGVFDESTITSLLQRAVDFATSSGQDYWLETSKCLQVLFEQIYAGMCSDSKLSEGTMLALDVISCGQKLRKLIDQVSPSTSPDITDNGQACVRAMLGARRLLAHSLGKVFLRAALCSPHQNYSASQETVTLLLKLHANSTPAERACSHTKRPSLQNPPTVAFVEASSSPADAPLAWRDEIHEYMQSRAENDRNRLQSIFASACADLEARCESVEAPLQEERARREALQRRYDELERSYHALEAESAARNVRLDAMEVEREQHIGNLEAQREEIDCHERRIEELLQAVQRTREEAEQAVLSAKSRLDSAELDRAAASARKDEEIEGVRLQVQRAENEAEEKMTELVSVRTHIEKLQKTLRRMQQELDNSRHRENGQQAEVARLQNDNDAMTSRIERLSTEIDTVREDAIAQRKAFERDLGDLKQKSAHDIAAAIEAHEEKVETLTRKQEDSNATLRRQIAEAQDEVAQAREQHRADIEQWEAEIDERQKKIDRLVRKCNEKDKQIAEANSMRTNLMAAMGLGGAQSHAQVSPHRPNLSSTTQRTQYQQMDSQDDPSPPIPFSGDDSQQLGLASNSIASNATSSGESRSGPAPKRPRPRKSIKAHSPAKPTARLSINTRSAARSSLAPPMGRSATKIRQPLLGVSGNQNRLPVRPSLKTPSEGLGAEDESFGGSEIFAGTQGLEAMDLGAALDEETEVGL